MIATHQYDNVGWHRVVLRDEDENTIATGQWTEYHSIAEVEYAGSLYVGFPPKLGSLVDVHKVYKLSVVRREPIRQEMMKQK